MIPILLIGAAYLIGKTIKEESYAKGGAVNLVAPNGKPSKLTPEQWHLVRTPEFKAWFGDWENNPENASKVVDEETKEPLVCYHGTFRNFNIFEISTEGGYFFVEDKKIAKIYSEQVQHGIASKKNKNPRIVDVFLNIKKPNKKDFKYQSVKRLSPTIKSSKNKNFDGLFIKNGLDVGGLYTQIVAFNSNQVKLADGTNTKFNAKNPDIRYGEGGEIGNKYFWGNVGAGILPICKKTGRILLNLRSSYVLEPNTYGVYGGKLDDEVEDEAGVISAAKREFNEETGYDGKIDIVPSYIYRYKNVFTYYNFIGIIEDEFEPELDWESDGYKWLTLKEFLEIEPKHFGLQELIKNDINTIKKYAKKK